MRWIVPAASTLAAALLWLPGQAAQPDAKPAQETISFEQYRDWRNHFIEERQTQLAARLATAANLTAAQRSRTEQQKAYYDWFAGLSAQERDRLEKVRLSLSVLADDEVPAGAKGDDVGREITEGAGRQLEQAQDGSRPDDCRTCLKASSA